MEKVKKRRICKQQKSNPKKPYEFYEAKESISNFSSEIVHQQGFLVKSHLPPFVGSPKTPLLAHLPNTWPLALVHSYR